MSRQLFLTEYPGKLESVISLQDYLIDKFSGRFSLFKPIPLWGKLFIRLIIFFCVFLRYLFRKDIWVENEIRELFAIDSRARRLLIRLLRNEVIVSWQQTPLASDLPPIIHVMTTLSRQQTPSGRVYSSLNPTGAGAGRSLNRAIIPALAETLERHSMLVWNEKNFKYGSFESLQNAGAINPNKFLVYSEEQLCDPKFLRSKFDFSTKFHWLPAVSLIENKKCLVPVQGVYFNYESENPEEPILGPATSNGVAAGGDYWHAAYNAICEGIERDGFLIHWLTKVPPRKIIFEKNTKIKKLQDELNLYGVNLIILDTTLETGIPAMSSVLLDRKGVKAVCVSAVAGLEIDALAHKLYRESLKQLHFINHINKDSFDGLGKNIVNFEQRRSFWADQSVIEKISFFINGETVYFNEFKEEHRNVIDVHGYKQKIHILKNLLAKANFESFLLDITDKEACSAGLKVVKAIIPGLVPMYFNEARKPLGIKRLYSFQIEKKIDRIHGLNELPHPFI